MITISLPKRFTRVQTTTFLLKFLNFSSTTQYSHPTLHPLPKNLDHTTLVSSIVSQPDPIAAVHLFRWASRQKKFHHTSSTFAHLIFKLGTAGKSEEMDEFLKEMVRFQYPDVEFSFKFLVETLCMNDKLTEAYKVFETACSAKLSLPVSTYNAILNALVEERSDFCKVLFVYKEMVKSKTLPNVDTSNILIKCLIENGMIELASSQFRKIGEKNCKANSLTYEILICGLCCNEKVDEAVRISNEMVESECGRDIGFYTNVIPWFCKVYRLDQAIRLFSLMKVDGFVADSRLHCVLIEYLSKSLMVNEAIKVFDEMLNAKFSPESSVLVDIVNMYCKLGKFNEALKFIEKNHIPEPEPYNALLQSLFEFGKFQEATKYFNTMQEVGMIDVRSWNIIIRYYCDKGNIGKAFEVIGRMIIFSCLPNEATYSSIITAFCEKHSYDSALDWFWQGLAKNVSFDTEACCKLIEGLCCKEAIEDALKIFFCLVSKGIVLHVDSLNILIQRLAHTGRLNEAIKVRSVAVCSGTSTMSSTFEITMMGLLNSNDDMDVLPLVAQMLIEGCTLNSATYNTLIHGLSVKDTTSALMLFNQMIKDGFIPDYTMLETLVYSASNCLKLHMVVHSLEKAVKDMRIEDPKLCNMTVYGLLKEGCSEEACKFLDWMLEKGWVPDSKTHELLIGSNNAEEINKGKYDVPEDGDRVGIMLSEGLSNIR